MKEFKTPQRKGEQGEQHCYPQRENPENKTASDYFNQTKVVRRTNRPNRRMILSAALMRSEF